jgi:hypothetical protein
MFIPGLLFLTKSNIINMKFENRVPALYKLKNTSYTRIRNDDNVAQWQQPVRQSWLLFDASLSLLLSSHGIWLEE